MHIHQEDPYEARLSEVALSPYISLFLHTTLSLSLFNDFFTSALHVVFEVGPPHAAMQQYSA